MHKVLLEEADPIIDLVNNNPISYSSEFFINIDL